MKVLLLLAKGFETMEFSAFVDVFGWAREDFGSDVTLHTCGFAEQVISTFRIPVIADAVIDGLNPDEYDALAIPGGFEEYGFYEEAYDERFLNLIRNFHQSGKPVASICVAALSLGKSGILKGKRATTYHLNGGRRQKQLAEFGAVVVNEPVVTDGNIITSYCPQTGPYVALKLLELMTTKELSDTVKTAMGF